MIIHISGSPYLDMSILSNYINNKYKNVLVYDLYDIYYDFIEYKEKSNENTHTIKKHFVKDFQEFINDLIKVNKNRHIVFIGLNYPDSKIEFRSKAIFLKPFKLHIGSNFNFFMDVPCDVIAKQYLCKTLQETIYHIDDEFDKIENNKKYIINVKEIIDNSKLWRNIFIKNGYQMITPEKMRYRIDRLLMESMVNLSLSD